jgi:signal transduction histidine kinase
MTTTHSHPVRSPWTATAARTAWRLTVITARDAAVLLAAGLIALAAFVLLPLALAVLVFSPVAGLGLPFLAVVTWLIRPLAQVERYRVRLVTGTPVGRAYRPLQGSLLRQVRIVVTDSGTWRDLCWLAAQVVSAAAGLAALGGLITGLVLLIAGPALGMADEWPGGPVSPPRALGVMALGAAIAAASWWPCRWLAPRGARMSGWLLRPGEGARLRAELEHLAVTRDETVDARATELRRIERDLHDGAQARLVSLAMSLGLVEQQVGTDPAAARQLIAEARGSASIALTELRGLVRGIHPPVLTERGLSGAVEALALASAVPVEVDVQLGGRLAGPLESALYFVIAEALANVGRHSEATWAFVRVWLADGRLAVLVRDDGRGGADPSRGSGLRGIEQRLAAFDGTFTVTSPPGGPTELCAELPVRG